MKKNTLIFIMVLATTISSFAQRKLSLGIGPTVAFPIGNFKDINSTGFGGVGQITLGLSDNLDLYVGLGLTSFKGEPLKKTTLTFSNLLVFDSKIGIRYTTNGFHAGAAVSRTAFFYTYSGTAGSVSGFGLSPEIGYKKSIFDLSLNFNFNVASYEVVDNNYNTVFETNTLNYVGLKLLINFYETKLNF